MPYVMTFIANNIVWVWLIVFVAALLIELVTSDLVSIWFSLAAIPPFILALLEASILAQSIVFLVVSFVLIVFTRPYVYKYFKTNEIKTNVDAMVGAIGTVTQDITPLENGRVKYKSQDWSAASKEVIKAGSQVRVLDIEGNKLIVESLEEK
jgi:membrane protein implicated in regulation of membrane protease activity